jgi:hypothetical protein
MLKNVHLLRRGIIYHLLKCKSLLIQLNYNWSNLLFDTMVTLGWSLEKIGGGEDNRR